MLIVRVKQSREFGQHMDGGPGGCLLSLRPVLSSHSLHPPPQNTASFWLSDTQDSFVFPPFPAPPNASPDQENWQPHGFYRIKPHYDNRTEFDLRTNRNLACSCLLD